MGLADFISKQFYEEIEFESTYLNAITSTEPNSIKLPMVLDNDEYVFKACAKTCGILNYQDIKLVIIENTKNLNKIYMSKEAYNNISNYNMVKIEGDYFNIKFDDYGNFIV